MTASTRVRNPVVIGFKVVASKPGEPAENAKPISRLFHAREAAVAFKAQADKTGRYGVVWVRDEMGFDDLS